MKNADEMTEEEFIANVKYGIMVVPTGLEEKPTFGDVLHFAGFVEEPKQADYDGIRKELEENEEFGLRELINDCDVISAPPEIVSEFMKTIQ